jgi:hypothetical protein
MVDPTSNVGDEDPDDVPTCATCGDPAVGRGRRVTTRVEAGRVVHTHFCSDACVDAYEGDET